AAGPCGGLRGLRLRPGVQGGSEQQQRGSENMSGGSNAHGTLMHGYSGCAPYNAAGELRAGTTIDPAAPGSNGSGPLALLSQLCRMADPRLSVKKHLSRLEIPVCLPIISRRQG